MPFYRKTTPSSKPTPGFPNGLTRAGTLFKPLNDETKNESPIITDRYRCVQRRRMRFQQESIVWNRLQMSNTSIDSTVRIERSVKTMLARVRANPEEEEKEEKREAGNTRKSNYQT
uniref:Uncharacterized protein n=1 Tax=Cacopsylla melanoneura TaxID=428564 RepID=A0A8D8WY88_9HEMI